MRAGNMSSAVLKRFISAYQRFQTKACIIGNYDGFGVVGRGNAMSVIDPHTDVGKRPPPWDEYWTFGWLFLVQVLHWILAVILVIVFKFKVDYQSSGGLVWIIVLYAVQIGAVTLLARLAHWPAREYLSLIRPNGRDTVIAIVSVALFIPAWYALA